MSSDNSPTSKLPKDAIPGESYIPPWLLGALFFMMAVSAVTMMFSSNPTLVVGALILFGATLINWIVAAAVGASRSGVPFRRILWMSIKNLFRLVFDFLP